MTVAGDQDLAFSGILPIIEPKPKPREVGLTEVRTASLALEDLLDWLEFLEPYLDSIKWTVGAQRLIPREKVREINAAMAQMNIGVSSGGLLESTIPHGEKAVRAFLEEAREVGFTVIEISVASLAISVSEMSGLIKAVADAGLKPKPEISPMPPGDRTYTNADKVIRECEAALEAGAWKIMMDEDTIFDGTDPEQWDLEFADRVTSIVPVDKIYWEASSVQISSWLLQQFGPDVNLFGGFENLAYIAAMRSGMFGPLAGQRAELAS